MNEQTNVKPATWFLHSLYYLNWLSLLPRRL
jgi:hypothetical protein